MATHMLLCFVALILPFASGQEDEVTYSEDGWTFQCEIERDIVYPFNDVEVLTSHTLAQCCEACWNNDYCIMWSWINGTCTLKNEQEGEGTEHVGAVTGWIGTVWAEDDPTIDPDEVIEAEDAKIETLTNTEIEIYLWGSDMHKELPSLFDDVVVSTSSTIAEMPEVGELYQNDIGRTRIIVPGTEIKDKFHRVVFQSPRKLPGDKEKTKTSFKILSTVTFEKDPPLTFSLKVNVLIKAMSDLECTGDSSIIMGEVGTVSITDEPVDVNFKNKYKNPVVIAQPLSYFGKDIAITRITKVSTDKFTIAIHEPSYLGGNHKEENVSYMVVEAGSWELENGYRLEVGKYVSSATIGNGLEASLASWTSVEFPAKNIFTTPPVVFSQTQSFNDEHWVATRQREVTEAGFKVALEEEEENEETHGGEVIGWVAIDTNKGKWSDNIDYEVGTVYPVTHEWTTINFGKSYTGKKSFLAVIQTWMGADSAHLRYKDLGDNSVKIKIEEEESKDEEKNHIGESVGYILFGDKGTIKGIPGDCGATPIADDIDEDAIVGEVAKFQLLKKDEYGSMVVELQTLPTRGILFQYESEYEGVKELMDKYSPILSPTTLEDSKGRVLYVPSVVEDDPESRSFSDSFTYVLSKKSVKSNVARVDIEVRYGKIPATPIPPRPNMPSPQPQPHPQTPTAVTEDSYKMPLMVIAVMCVAVVLVIAVLGYFLYKKKYGTNDMIGFFKSKVGKEGGVTYFPSGDEDSLASPAETHFHNSDTSDSGSP